MIRVCICGGGSLAHVCAGVLSFQSEVDATHYVHHPLRAKALTPHRYMPLNSIYTDVILLGFLAV